MKLLENNLCKGCEYNYYHYQILHVEKCDVLKDPIATTSWEKKIEKLEKEEEKWFDKIDRNINTTIDSLMKPGREDSE